MSATDEWREAAVRWRDQYLSILAAFLAALDREVPDDH